MLILSKVLVSVIGREGNSERKFNSFQTRTLHGIKVTRIQKNTQEYTRIHKNTQEYTRIHKNTQEQSESKIFLYKCSFWHLYLFPGKCFESISAAPRHD